MLRFTVRFEVLTVASIKKTAFWDTVKWTDVSDVHTASIIDLMMEEVLPKRRYTSKTLHGAIFQNALILITIYIFCNTLIMS
jgi:hypothetical protein